MTARVSETVVTTISASLAGQFTAPPRAERCMPQVDAAALNRFLTEIERRAFGMARMAVGNTDDALDIVQDAMMTLARKYADKPTEQWRPLFYRILQNRITDFHRRQTVRGRLFALFEPNREDDEAPDPLAAAPGPEAQQPDLRMMLDGAVAELGDAVAGLPARQQQAFLLRVWEGMNVHDTARAMGCSEGSVKTHYSRAVHALRGQLEDHWHD